MNKMINGVLVAMSDEEIAIMNTEHNNMKPVIARQERDDKLAESDTDKNLEMFH